MRTLLIGVLALLAIGCTSSRTYVASPMESEHNGQRYHYHNLVVLQAPASLFHATESRSWMEYCKTKIENPATQEEWNYPYQDCVMNSQYMANVAPSVSQQAVTPIVSTAIGAAGFAVGMHQLGKGISKSGDRTTNNNNNDTSSTGGNSSATSSSKSKATGGSSAATNNVNSGNKTTNANRTTNINNSHTNINSNNNSSVGGGSVTKSNPGLHLGQHK